MEMVITNFTPSGINEMEIRHNDETLKWNVKFYNRSSFIQVNQIFAEINEYFSILKTETLDAIWMEYKRIHYALNRITNVMALRQEMIRLVGKLYSHLDIDHMDAWVEKNPRISIPPGLKTEFEPGDTARDRTYLRSEYHGLMVLALILRPMVPVWAGYIESVKSFVGRNYKEINAYGLLRETRLHRHPYMQRLLRYIEASINATIEKEKSHLGLVINFLGSSEIPSWLLAWGLIRRLAVGNVSATVETESIISNFYNAVIKNAYRSAVSSNENSFKAKTSPNDNDDNTSIFEENKVKQVRSDGPACDVSVYLLEYFDPTTRLKDPLPEALWKEYLAIEDAVSPTPKRAVHDGLMVLVMCCARLKPLSEFIPPELMIEELNDNGIITPMSVNILDASARRRGMLITAAILQHWKFHELAAAMLSTPTLLDEEGIINVQPRARIQRNYVDYFSEAYPYYQRAPGNSTTARKQNVACLFIDEMTELLVGPTIDYWKGPIPASLRESIVSTERGEIIFSRNIKQTLCELVKFCYEQHPGN